MDRSQMKHKNNPEARLAYWMLVPTFTIVFAFVVFPVLWNLWLSFKPVSLGDLRGAPLLKFNVTLENFLKVLGEPEFPSILFTTLAYTVLGSALSIALDVHPGVGSALPRRKAALAR